MFSIGPIDSLKAIEIIRSYLVAFFDKTLKHKQSQLLQQDNQDTNQQLIIT